MKTIPYLSTMLLCACVLTDGAEAQTSFTYNMQDVFSPNALEYIVQENNIQQTQEPITADTDVSYWNPINNGQIASLTFEFTFSQPTTSIFLNARVTPYNFGGSDYGSGSLLASTDGVNWTTLINAPTPPTEPGGASSIFDSNLPTSLTGTDEIWIQVQLETSGDDILSQFCRQDLDANGGTGYVPDIFQLQAELVPEPSTATLAIIGGLGAYMLRKKRKNLLEPQSVDRASHFK